MLIAKSLGGLYLNSPYLLWLVKLLAGAAGNRRNMSGATNEDRYAGCAIRLNIIWNKGKEQFAFRKRADGHF